MIPAPAFIEDITTLNDLAFDTVIDVRSPSEFAEDHVPGAVNLPVLSDAERAEVGTLYTQVSKFQARRRGAAYVARNIARHLEERLSDQEADLHPLIYCWRGGMRSGAMATVFAQIGWRTTLLRGGYRAYRRYVRAKLYEGEPGLRVVLLAGDTGAAKTDILALLAARGLQTLDLEALAAHRGSVFGALSDQPQPSQKMFESRLLQAAEQLDPSRPVIVEAESSKIGDRIIPPTLWKAMSAAPEIAIRAPLAARARHIMATYGELMSEPDRVEAILASLAALHPAALIAEWREWARAGRFGALVSSLLENHYDPAYRRSRRRAGRASLGVVDAPALNEAGRADAADAAAQLALGARMD